MDAEILLAVTSKLKRIFQWEGSSVAFPIGFISYSAEAFRDLTKAPDTPQQAKTLREFSYLVNSKPGETVWNPSIDVPLWDVIAEIFDTAELADQDINIELESSSVDLGVLEATELSSFFSSQTDVARNQLEDRKQLISQRIRVLEDKIELAHLSSDQFSALNDQKERMTRDLQDMDVGSEDALLKPMASKPVGQPRFQTIWSRWSSKLDEAMDYKTDLLEFRFVPSVYAPSNIVNSPAWVEIEIKPEDFPKLLEDANPELVKRFGMEAGETASSTHLRFEATSVHIIRSWLPRRLFSARFWRFSDQEKTLDWPGYVTGLILIRNIEIITEKGLRSDSGSLKELVSPDQPLSTDPDPSSTQTEFLGKLSRFRWMQFGTGLFLFSITLAWGLGRFGHIYLPFAVTGTLAIAFGSGQRFHRTVKRQRFASNVLVKTIAWLMFVLCILILALAGILLVFFVAVIESGELLEVALSLLFLFSAIVLMVLAVLWSLNHWQPMRRSASYFKDQVAPEVYDRIDDVTDTNPRSERWAKKGDDIFIAGFRIKTLDKVPNPDERLSW